MWGRFWAGASLQLPLLLMSHRRQIFVFFYVLPNPSTLFTSQTTASHSQTAELRAARVNSSTHNPPGGNGVRAHAPVGTMACVFNASLRGGMGMQPVSGSGHIQYGGITPGSSEEMRTPALSLHVPRRDWKQNRAGTKCWFRSGVCPVDSPRRSEILEKMEDSQGLWAGKHAVAAAAAAATAAGGFVMYRKLHVKHSFFWVWSAAEDKRNNIMPGLYFRCSLSQKLAKTGVVA